MSDITIPAALTADAPNVAVVTGEVEASQDAVWIFAPGGVQVIVKDNVLSVIDEAGTTVLVDDHSGKSHHARVCAEEQVKIFLMTGATMVAGPPVDQPNLLDMISMIIGAQRGMF